MFEIAGVTYGIGLSSCHQIWPEAEYEARIGELWTPAPETWSLKRLGNVYGFVRVVVDRKRIRCEFLENVAGVLDTVEIMPRRL